MGANLSTLDPTQRDAVAGLFAGLITVRSISNYVRILRRRYANNPLSPGSGPSRFSPILSTLDALPQNPLFQVTYMAADLATAAYETLIRDRFDLDLARVLLPEDYGTHVAVNISTLHDEVITVVDLTDGNSTRHGVPSNVASYSAHNDGQDFATFVYANMPTVDGLLYRSRFTNQLNIAIFDRGIHRIVCGKSLSITQELLGSALRSWNIRVN